MPKRRQAIIWTNADLIHWRIYAALGRDELSTSQMAVDRPISQFPQSVCPISHNAPFRTGMSTLRIVGYETCKCIVGFVRLVYWKGPVWYYYCNLTRSQASQPMAAQLSNEIYAAIGLKKLMTASGHNGHHMMTSHRPQTTFSVLIFLYDMKIVVFGFIFHWKVQLTLVMKQTHKHN